MTITKESREPGPNEGSSGVEVLAVGGIALSIWGLVELGCAIFGCKSKEDKAKEVIAKNNGTRDTARQQRDDLKRKAQADKSEYDAERDRARADLTHGNVRDVANKAAEIDQRIREATADAIKKHNESIEQLDDDARGTAPEVAEPEPPVPAQPEVNPAAEIEGFEFKTDKGTSEYAELADAARYHQATSRWASEQTTYVSQRHGLLGMAKLSIRAADASYSAGDRTSGSSLLDVAGQILDSVYDFAADTVRSAINSAPAAFVAGTLHGAIGAPSEPAAGQEWWFALGEVVGAAAGLYADSALVVAGLTEVVGGGLVTVATGGAALPLGAGAAVAGLAEVSAGVAGASLHGQQLVESLQFLKSSARRPSGYRSWVSGHTGKNPKGYDAHHFFPVQYLDKFKRLGIDIWDPKYGTWWELHAHRQKWYEYNQQWARFFEGKALTAQKARKYARELAKHYGLEVWF